MAEIVTDALTWWDDPETGRRWIVLPHWQDIDGRAECIGLELRGYSTGRDDDPAAEWLPLAGDASPVLTASVLRRLPIATLLAQTRDQNRVHASFSVDLDDDQQADAASLWSTTPPGEARYRLVAEIYKAADQRGMNRTPTKTVAVRFGISHSAAAKLVGRARERGFLPPTTKGKSRSTDSQENS